VQGLLRIARENSQKEYLGACINLSVRITVFVSSVDALQDLEDRTINCVYSMLLFRGLYAYNAQAGIHLAISS